MISDRDVVATVELVRTRAAGDPSLDYTIDDFRLRPGAMDVRLTQGDWTARLVVGLPSSGGPWPWLYAVPEDASDWAGQLLIWLDEEVFTGGLGPSRAREERAGESYVIVESYGWRLSDAGKHLRLSRHSTRFQ